MVAKIHKPRRALLFLSLLIVLGLVFLAWFQFDANRAPSLPPTSSKPDKQAATPPKKSQATCIKELPDTTKLGQKIMVAGYADSLDSHATSFAKHQLGGVILMDETPKSTIVTFKSQQPIPPFIATDQEGGSVQRYTSEGILPSEPAMAQASLETAFKDYLRDDTYLTSLGITTNFAPVVDVGYPGKNPLPDRIYSSNQSTVTSYATQSIKAAKEAGLQPVIKHFPGLGSADGNTDYGAASTVNYVTLKHNDLIPYQKLLSLNPDIMVSNATIPGLTQGAPASLSRVAITDTLRAQLGYKKAVVYTDSLTAKAVPGLLSNASVKAWKAGADVALIVQTQKQDSATTDYIESIVQAGKQALANKTLSEDELNASIGRIFARKGVDACKVQSP